MSEPDALQELQRKLAAAEGEIAALRVRVAEAETTSAATQSQLQRYAADLNAAFLQERETSAQLERSYRATVRALANAVEARDAYTGRHAERVTGYGIAIAREAGVLLSTETEYGFLLHDVGKVAVPDAILFKPAALTDDERRVMANHTVTGAEILRDVGFLDEARVVVRSHHERWDGGGYPDGLAGDAIPAAARAFAVADALDALTTDRPYRPRSSFAEAREEIVAAAGTQFDPAMVAALVEIDDDRLRAGQEDGG